METVAKSRGEERVFVYKSLSYSYKSLYSNILLSSYGQIAKLDFKIQSSCHFGMAYTEFGRAIKQPVMLLPIHFSGMGLRLSVDVPIGGSQ